ncbi:MAG: ATP-binding protein [candidate division KSB1 bacterium]|nr:ATP-binding protein [candidate division KSB1 bacterium]MDZ7273371.1 ATP-binding protein [candidate division KSB1 bacterium]MDZ7288033.1 ATP-binding protein [candidate division KSB1 bacterium]MDZ7300115.1 ATP-binding protein [candidate division KSB1 bacterium]MDZ7308940.1 ATP-binding protein [candidate division KSB1 bacterium]
MTFFFLWLAIILFLLAGYLAYRWWHPTRRSRFQVRLTALFLLFAIGPSVPLLFVASTLTTSTIEMLLVPEVEATMLQAVQAMKQQLESHAGNFVQAVQGDSITPALLHKWGFDYFLVWRKEGETVQLVQAVGREEAAYQQGLHFDGERLTEAWGQRDSELESTSRDSSGLRGHCRVWLPRGEREMVLVGYAVAPEIAAAKVRLTQAIGVYNSLSLIKERALHDELIWGGAVAAILLLALLSIASARLLSQRLSRPLEQLTQASLQVARGNLQVQAATSAKDEIRQLVDSFNHMISELRASRERLVISERLAAWREVARQVAHEIKNPLTPIQLALYRVRQRLDESTAAQPAVQESFQSIAEELASLRHLAEEFSEFARLPKADLQPGNLNEVVQLTARLFQGAGGERQIKTELEPDIPPRPFDREQIKRLLNNLIKNALEAGFTPGGTITLRTQRAGDKVRLIIADQGPGLPPDMLEKIFEPNFSTKRGGSGLGLTMVKRIVEEHGGTITVESAAGKGTTFTIVL